MLEQSSFGTDHSRQLRNMAAHSDVAAARTLWRNMVAHRPQSRQLRGHQQRPLTGVADELVGWIRDHAKLQAVDHSGQKVCHAIDRDPARNPEPAEPVPKTKQAGWPAPMMTTPGRLTQMGTQNLTIGPAAASRQ
jgi:hypothetical protein